MTLRVRALAPRDHPALSALLASGGVADAWLAHGLRVGGLRGFIGAFDDGALVGAALLRGGAVCAASLTPPRAAEALVPALRERGPWFSVVGPERPCSILAAGLSGRLSLRVDRVQVFMAIEDAARLGPIDSGVRTARPSDLDALVPLVTRYRIEDGLSRPEDDPVSWVRAHVRERIEQGLIHVLERDGRIVFTGAFNFLGSDGAGLGGIYTVPEMRGLGVATRATAALCRRAFEVAPAVSLHVDGGNAPARRAYARAGLVEVGHFRLTFR